MGKQGTESHYTTRSHFSEHRWSQVAHGRTDSVRMKDGEAVDG
jgi:hypothetical protein